MENDLHGDVKKLTKHTHEYWLRGGDWRMLFEIEINKIVIYKIKHRRNAYR
jgi:mRNA interferase RelE/StbE